MSELDRQFAALADSVTRLIALLEESGDAFWIPCLRRGLADVRAHKLAGATLILGCYGGVDTFSDLVIGRALQDTDALAFENLNARLSELRTGTFEAANAITARRAW